MPVGHTFLVPENGGRSFPPIHVIPHIVFCLDFCFSVPSPPLEWTSFPPLVTAVFITHKGAESPGNRRKGVTGAVTGR